MSPLGYSQITPTWHVIRLSGLAFFGRTKAAVEAKERRYWINKERAKQRARRRAIAAAERRNSLAFTDTRHGEAQANVCR